MSPAFWSGLTRARDSRFAPLAIGLSFAVVAAVVAVRVPGLDWDEIITLDYVDLMMHGVHPSSGVVYTGLIYTYLAWLFVPMAPIEQHIILRLIAACANGAAIAFGMAAVRRLHPAGSQATWFALLAATTPVFFMYSGIGLELTALGPCLLGAGAYFSTLARDLKAERSWVAAMAAGVFFGLAVRNHAAVAAVPISLATAMVLVLRRALLQSPTFAAGIASFVIVTATRFFDIFFAPRTAYEQHVLGTLWSADKTQDLRALPLALARVLDGTQSYLRFCGQTTIPVIPYLLAAVAVLAAMQIIRREERTGSALDRVLAMTCALQLAMTFVTAPYIAARYFIPTALMCAYLLVRLAARNGKVGRLPAWVLGGVVALNVFYLGTNYLFTFARTGGRTIRFSVGSYLESSLTSLDTRHLYGQLMEKGICRVYASPPISNSLLYWRLHAQRAGEASTVLIGDLPGTPPEPTPVRLGRYAIDSNSAPTHEGELTEPVAMIHHEPDLPGLFEGGGAGVLGPAVIHVGDLAYDFDPTFDRHFRVYVARPRRSGDGP